MPQNQDFRVVTVLGGLVGILVQPVLTNNLETVSASLRIVAFLVMLIGAPSALFFASLIAKKVAVVYQFAKFASVGVLNSMIDAGVFNILVAVSGIAAGFYASVFKGISFIVTTTNSFFWNKYWTFSSGGGPKADEAAKFYSVALIGWVINVSLFTFVVNFVSHPAAITAKQWANVGVLAGIAGSFLWNFIGYKFFVFKKTG